MTTAMSTVNQTFDWNRFVATLRKEVAENGRTLLLLVAGIYIYFTAELMLINVSGHGMYDNVHDPFLFLMALGIFVSLGFSKLTTKGKRTDYFVTASSSAEKFFANTLIYVIGGLVVVHVCSYLADLSRIALLWFRQSDSFLVPGLSALPNTIIKWIEPDSTFAACLPQWIAHCVLVVSVFMFGSIVAPRYSFLKTTVIFIIIFCIISYGVIGFNEPAADYIKYEKEKTLRMFVYIACGFAVLLWVAGWFLFKRKDAIPHKRLS